jgi:hypothetical protein
MRPIGPRIKVRLVLKTQRNEKTMNTTATRQAAGSPQRPAGPANHPIARELDYRASDGIAVRLLWNQQTGRVSIVVNDLRRGESLAFEVEAAEALQAFQHPYAYAASLPVTRQLHHELTPKEIS